MAIDNSRVQDEKASFSRFYMTVLSWDYFDLDQKSSSPFLQRCKKLKEVKDRYRDVDDYLSIYEPLLFEEVKAQIAHPGDDEVEGGLKLKQKMCLLHECNEIEGFHFPVVGYISEEGESISQNDLVLLSAQKFQGNELSITLPHAFALVEHRQRESLKLRMFLADEVQGTNIDDIKPTDRLDNMRKLLTQDNVYLFISKVCSLSTIFREFVGVRSIHSNPFKDVILEASDSSINSTVVAWEIPRKLMESIEINHNESQLEAIRAGLSRKPFVLIQGPPGTGKTQTILGLLNALLHSVPAKTHGNGTLRDMRRGPELLMGEKLHHWRIASPWMIGTNPRDEIMPVDGNDGFFPTTGNELKPEVVSSNRKYRVRVLVCAPSNSALDEIVLRVLNNGVRDENDRAYNPKIVRIGLKAHHSVQSVSMDYLVEQKLAALEGHEGTDRQNNGASRSDRDSIRNAILDEAVIVFSTLSFSGSTIFAKLNRSFDVVVIDEAAQAVEPATLVPLATGCKQVFLVGDPVQLPATVISSVAQEYGYGISLFERFQKAGYPVLMLKTQYRMHPEIRTFPSREFYEDALEDGTDVKEQTTRSWHSYKCFRPFCFFDVKDGAETRPDGSRSWVNEDEVNFGLLMYRELVDKCPELKSSSRLAIITPYQRQVKLFRKRFREMFGVDSEKVVDINTIDGFQGREKDVTIFSCVRASEDKKIGFVSDFRRMNVGITRARSSVLVLGSATTLKREDKHWSNLIEAAEKNESLFEVSKPYTSFFSEEHMKSMLVKRVAEPEEEVDGELMDVDANYVDQGPYEDYGDGDYMGGDDDD